jgi:hypothetical protein
MQASIRVWTPQFREQRVIIYVAAPEKQESEPSCSTSNASVPAADVMVYVLTILCRSSRNELGEARRMLRCCALYDLREPDYVGPIEDDALVPLGYNKETGYFAELELRIVEDAREVAAELAERQFLVERDTLDSVMEQAAGWPLPPDAVNWAPLLHNTATEDDEVPSAWGEQLVDDKPPDKYPETAVLRSHFSTNPVRTSGSWSTMWPVLERRLQKDTSQASHTGGALWDNTGGDEAFRVLDVQEMPGDDSLCCHSSMSLGTSSSSPLSHAHGRGGSSRALERVRHYRRLRLSAGGGSADGDSRLSCEGRHKEARTMASPRQERATMSVDRDHYRRGRGGQARRTEVGRASFTVPVAALPFSKHLRTQRDCPPLPSVSPPPSSQLPVGGASFDGSQSPAAGQTLFGLFRGICHDENCGNDGRSKMGSPGTTRACASFLPEWNFPDVCCKCGESHARHKVRELNDHLQELAGHPPCAV